MPASASSPVSEAIYAALLADATLMAALTGGVHDDLPQGRTYPCLWYEVKERDIRGFGTGGLPEVELRTHVFSTFGGMAEAQACNRLVAAVLKDARITVTGYAQCGHVTYRETVPIGDADLNGVKVKEVVSTFTIWVEEAA